MINEYCAGDVVSAPRMVRARVGSGRPVEGRTALAQYGMLTVLSAFNLLRQTEGKIGACTVRHAHNDLLIVSAVTKMII